MGCVRVHREENIHLELLTAQAKPYWGLQRTEYYNSCCKILRSRRNMQKSAYSVSALFTHHLYSTLSCSVTVQQVLKRQFTQKGKVLWPLTQPHAIQNLYVFLSSVKHKRRYFEECFLPYNEIRCYPKLIKDDKKYHNVT